MNCPKCGGATFDNVKENDARLAAGEKIRPDYKCRDKDCGGVVWRPKDGQRVAGVPAKPAAQQVSYDTRPSHNGHDANGRDFLDRSETGAAPNDGGGSRIVAWGKLFEAYDLCMGKAVETAKKMDAAEIGSSPESVAAIAATLLIQADRQGLTR